MSITSYSALKTGVVNYLHRPSLVSDVAECISRAESRLLRELDIKATEVKTTGTTSGGTIAIPSGLGRVTRISVLEANIERALDYFPKPVDYVATISSPQYFSQEDGAIRLHDAPGTGYSYTLHYIPNILPLSDSNTSNWLLVNADDLYLYASALEGARFLRNVAEENKLEVLCYGLDGKGGLLDAVRRKAERRLQPRDGSLQIKPRR